jgi:hypothetical protein
MPSLTFGEGVRYATGAPLLYDRERQKMGGQTWLFHRS